VLQYDALGRLTAVWADPSGSNYETLYTYGANNTLQRVVQGAETRTFTYDSLGRLKSSVQPESGTVSYTYDAVGNVHTRTDARNVVATYSYDGLNRLQTIQYTNDPSNTPWPTFSYDAAGYGYSWGHLTSVSNGTARIQFGSISPLGQVTASSETTASQTYNFSYYYNSAGALTQENYPSGRVITTGYDTANRPNSVSGSYGGVGKTYVSAVGYWPHGGPGNVGLGNNVHHDSGESRAAG
jgi:YD repeat-containing protein